MRLLICGGREYDNREAIYYTLDDIDAAVPVTTLVQGGCRGADAVAASWAYSRRIPVEEYRADWINHGRAAGPIRNQRMLAEGRPNAYHAFPGGKGTADMVRRCKRAGIKEI